MKLGQAFSDSVIIEAKTASRVGKISPRAWWLGAGRALLFTTILLAALFALGWRLFDLTIIHGYEFRALSDGNRTRELIRHAPRGKLLDRTGRELAGNTPTYRLILPCTTSSADQCTKIIDAATRTKLVKQGLPQGAYIEDDFTREYPAGPATSHVVGYTGEISDKELADPYYKLRGYRPGVQQQQWGARQGFLFGGGMDAAGKLGFKTTEKNTVTKGMSGFQKVMAGFSMANAAMDFGKSAGGMMMGMPGGGSGGGSGMGSGASANKWFGP